MKLDSTSINGRSTGLWNSRNLVSAIVIVLTAFIFCFGLVGVDVALSSREYREYCWVPVLLVILSGLLLIIKITRILRRILKCYTERDS
nr:hypothetical protein [Desulfobacterales bacterium]